MNPYQDTFLAGIAVLEAIERGNTDDLMALCPDDLQGVFLIHSAIANIALLFAREIGVQEGGTTLEVLNGLRRQILTK